MTRRYKGRCPDLLAGRNEPLPRVTVADVIEAASRLHGVCAREIAGPLRHRDIMRARHLAVEVAAQLTGQSTPQLGRRFGARDHTTIMHSRGVMAAAWEAGCEMTRQSLRDLARAAIAIAEDRGDEVEPARLPCGQPKGQQETSRLPGGAVASWATEAPSENRQPKRQQETARVLCRQPKRPPETAPPEAVTRLKMRFPDETVSSKAAAVLPSGWITTKGELISTEGL